MAIADHLVLITVFDGLRPDFVRPDWTPHLWELRRRGVWFSRSHCVFPAVTRVNASALASGSLPGRHGIESNTVWRPDVDHQRPLRTSERADLLRLEAARGRLLSVPTLGEALAGVDRELLVVGTGSAGAASLLHPQASATNGRVLHFSFSVPDALGGEVAQQLGAWPVPADGTPYETLAVERVEYGFRALTDVLAPASRPPVAIFWCTVPDGPHHQFGLGDPRSLAALRAADAAFGAALAALEGLYEALDVFVTADHGYVTVAGHVDVAGELIAAGYKRSRDSTDVVVCTDGGAAPIYLTEAADTGAIVRFLLEQPWVSIVFSPGGHVPGTLPLEAAGGGGPDAPSLLLCLGWNDDANLHGIAGSGWGGGGIRLGAGDHGGLSSWEMANTLIAAGPSFHVGLESDLPCGILDVAPTVLRLLGLAAPSVWDGRVLEEALLDGGAAPQPGTEQITAVCDTRAGQVTQTLVLDTAGASRYPARAWRRRG